MTRRVHRPTSPRLLRLASAGALAAVLLGGCSQLSPQTTQLQYAASDGVMGQSGPLTVRNLLLVTDEHGTSATVAGTLVNSGEQPLTVELGPAAGAMAAEPIEVPADGLVTLATDDQRIEVPIQSGAGTLVPFVVRGASGNEPGLELTLNVPVLDGTLPEYASLTPAGSATS